MSTIHVDSHGRSGYNQVELLPLELSQAECLFLLDSVDPAEGWADNRHAGEWLTIKLIDVLLRILDRGAMTATIMLTPAEAAQLHHNIRSYSKDGKGVSMYQLWLRILRVRYAFCADSFLSAPDIEATTEEPQWENIKEKLEDWRQQDAAADRSAGESPTTDASAPARRSRRGPRAKKTL